MDGLSVAANAIAVLQIANSVISICYDFRLALKKSPWALTRVLDEVTELRGILEAIERLSASDDKATQNKLLQEKCNLTHGPLSTCMTALSHLEGFLGSTSTGTKPPGRWRALGQAVTWHFKDKEINEVLGTIDRCKNTLKLAMSTEEWVLLDKIHKTTETSSTSLSNVESQVESLVSRIDSQESNEKSSKLFDWLFTIDTSQRHGSTRRLREAHTGQWFFRSLEFRQFIANECQSLWLSGFAGSGKSVLFSSIVEYTLDLQQCKKKALVAYFYCDFREREGTDPLSLIGNIVAQLCRQANWTPEVLQNAFEAFEASGQNRKPDISTFTETVRDLAEIHDVTILIDALDELDSRDTLLAWLTEINQDSTNLRMLVTSRDEVDIAHELHQFERLRMENHQKDLEEDIRCYLDSRLEGDRKLNRFSTTLRDEVFTSVSAKSHGMFRWAQCQLDALTHLKSTGSIRSTLSQLPDGLNETYASVLRKVPKSEARFVQRALCWLAFAVLPLALNELNEAIVIDTETGQLNEDDRLCSLSDILELCGSLVHLSDSGQVTLAHLSVRDYLLSDSIRQDEQLSKYSLEQHEARCELATRCLTYLQLPEMTTGPCTSVDLYKSRLSSLPFLRHGSTTWPYYFKNTNRSEVLEDIILEFFNSGQVFQSWVQIINADHPFKWDFYPRHATGLYYASSFGLTNLVSRLAGESKNINAPGSRFGGTALHVAIWRNHLDAAAVLLKCGADPNQQDWDSVSPLHSAASYDNVMAVKLLLENGASKDVKDKDGETPYDWAVRGGHIRTQRLLLGLVDPQHRQDGGTGDDDGAIEVWKCPKMSYFPNWYDARSGTGSSIIVRVEVGSEVREADT